MFLGLAKRYLPKGMDPEDCVQNAAVRALRFSKQFQGRSSLSTWFGTIVRNCALVRFRYLRNEVRLEQPESHGISLADILLFNSDELHPDQRIDRERLLSRLALPSTQCPTAIGSAFGWFMWRG